MTLLRRLSLSLASALLIAGITYALVNARSAREAPYQQNQELTCSICHPKISAAWENGMHSQALSDTEFTRIWTNQGKPGTCLECHVTGYIPDTALWQRDGVACEACHSPIPPGHPMDQVNYPVPVYRTAELCGKCHKGSHFNVEAWQTSSHFTAGIACIECHDPHSATLKTVAGHKEEGPSGLCMNCHREVSMKYPFSKHTLAGVSCVDCHLHQTNPLSDKDVHTIPDHTFTASLVSCSGCHAVQMGKNLQVHSFKQLPRSRYKNLKQYEIQSLSPIFQLK